jgi:aryl-alcohol dehydrogenase-like predicted oxidoreductase
MDSSHDKLSRLQREVLTAFFRYERRFFLTIAVDPPEEILANKLTTILSRAEERDLVDLLWLERKGLRIEGALEAALAKDGGCTPAALAWILSEVTVPDGATLPGGVTPGELRDFVADVIVRLRRASFPGLSGAP